MMKILWNVRVCSHALGKKLRKPNLFYLIFFDLIHVTMYVPMSKCYNYNKIILKFSLSLADLYYCKHDLVAVTSRLRCMSFFVWFRYEYSLILPKFKKKIQCILSLKAFIHYISHWVDSSICCYQSINSKLESLQINTLLTKDL